MPGDNRRGARSGASPESSATRTGAKRSASLSAPLARPVLGERHTFYCECCDHEADARYGHGADGIVKWSIGSLVDRCPTGKQCLAQLGDWLRVAPAELLEDPRPFLPVGSGGARRSTRTEPLLSEPAWSRARAALVCDVVGRDARRYLRRRGIDYRQHELGFREYRGCPAIVAPCYCGGAVTTETYRFYDEAQRLLDSKGKPIKNKMLYGREAGWIASMPPGRRRALLCAGTFDGLLARQRNFSAISGSCGAKLPDHLVPDLAGRMVAVAYDVGEEDAAARTVAKLRAAGNEAWVVRLAKLGLPEKGDISDHFRRGGTAEDLDDLIRRERRSA